MSSYRFPWNKENTSLLVEMWPHYGTIKMCELLNLKKSQIKGKVNKLKLKTLPKKKRLCVSCSKNFQSSRRYGLNCRNCALEKRKTYKLNTPKPMKIWMNELLRTVKYRSIEKSDLTLEYLVWLWEKQQGKCLYTNEKLIQPIYGRGRNLNTASLDRVDSNRGYMKGNVVWILLGCNLGKSDFTLKEYINLCKKISYREKEIISFFDNF